MVNNTDSEDVFISLLSELESTLDHSRLVEEIINRQQQLEKIEDITGPSKRTTKLHKEIDALEEILEKVERRMTQRPR